MRDRSAVAKKEPGLALIPGWWRIALLALPLLLLGWLMADPERNPIVHIPVPHAVIVSNVSVAALLAATAQAWAALRTRQDQLLLDALGFAALAGIFAVHAFSTPDVPWVHVLDHGAETTVTGSSYGPPARASQPPLGVTVEADSAQGAASSVDIVGMSAYLSVLVPALLFAMAHTRAVMLLQKAGSRGRAALIAAVTLGVGGYAVIALASPETFAPLMLAQAPTAQALVAASLTCLGFAALRRARQYYRSHLPTDGALAAAYVLLGEAQISMATTPVWSLAWWGYHALMLTAVVVAVGALYVELDRRRGLERFLSAPLVDRVLAADSLRLSGERRVVTILFADLRNSTALAESLSAEEVVTLLNRYVGVMARAVFAQGGMLDKYLGDGLMAIFGLGDDDSYGAKSAARAALQMRADLAVLNQERTVQGIAAVGFGVGIHTGEVVLGTVGIPERSDYTAIGDTVNTAARLESLCKEYRVQSVLSSDTAGRLGGAFPLRELGEVEVRGKTQSLHIATLDS